jgi:hypothetical protein
MQHADLWKQVEAANITGDLTDLTSLRHQQSIILDLIDQEMRNTRNKCELLDKRLDYYSRIKTEN